MSETVIVYTKLPDDTGHCPYCIKAMEFLNQRGITFDERQLHVYERQELYDQFELQGIERTVPQVVVVGETGEQFRVGGFNDLVLSGIESLFVDGSRSSAITTPHTVGNRR